MKKLFFIMAMSVCAFTAQAQTTSGIRVGLNMTSATGKYNDLMADQDYNNIRGEKRCVSKFGRSENI